MTNYLTVSPCHTTMLKQIANHCLLTLNQGHPCEVPAALRETSRLQGNQVGCGRWVVDAEGPGPLVSNAPLTLNGNRQVTDHEYYLKTVVAPHVTPQRSSVDQMRVGAWEGEGLARAGFGQSKKTSEKMQPFSGTSRVKIGKEIRQKREVMRLRWTRAWGWPCCRRR